jgi:hypothetical protein
LLRAELSAHELLPLAQNMLGFIMSDSPIIAPLRVANEAFLVSSMIERCPKTMMIRELVMNGLEAAEHAPTGAQKVIIGSRQFDGVRKLCIWNTGPGMTSAELLQITDLASSLRKQNSLDRNFGMGAKVASLPSNRHGLRYRSCAKGRVSEVMLGHRNGIYGRLHLGPENVEVLDVTEICRVEGGYDLSLDWTEVLLCGNRTDQDTVAAPYDGAPAVDTAWIGHYLENRFFRLPTHVTLTLVAGLGSVTAPRDLVGLDNRRSQFGRTETRTTASGVKLHYYFDPPEGSGTHSAAGAIAPSTSRGCVVFRDEMYDVRGGEVWLQDAPVYGISFGAKFCSVFVELPDDYPVWPEAYRQFLRFRGNEQKQVYLSDFSALVRANIPGWLAEIIRAFGPSQAHYVVEINDELKVLLAELGVRPQSAGASALDALLSSAKPTLPKSPSTEVNTLPAPPKEPPKPKPPVYERPPEIIGLRSAEMIKERALEGRAAKFYAQSHQIFINLTYPAIQEMASALQIEHDVDVVDDQEAVRRIATEVAEWCLTKRVTRALVYSLAKKALGWRPEEVTRGQSPESLSLVADDWMGLMDSARVRFKMVAEEYIAESSLLRTVAA